MEILSQEGLRQDGRTALCLRQMNCGLGLYDHPNGSAYVEMGNTKVLVAVYGPHEIKGSNKQQSEEVVIQCELSRIAASQGERIKRVRDPRTRSMSHQIAAVFEGVVRSTKYSGSQIDIFVQVLQTDGGVLSACINASSLALIHAGVEMNDYVCSCTATMHQGTPMLDASHIETQLGCELTLALLPNKGTIATLHISNNVHQSELDEVLNLATKGCKKVYKIMLNHVKTYLEEQHAVMSQR